LQYRYILHRHDDIGYHVGGFLAMSLSHRPSGQNGGLDPLAADFHSEVGRYIDHTRQTCRHNDVILIASEEEENIGYVDCEIFVAVDIWSAL
jgi:hypothetical protein